MPTLNDLTLVNSDGSAFNGVIPAGATVGSIIAYVAGLSLAANALIVQIGDSVGAGNGASAITRLGYPTTVVINNSESISGHAIADITADLGAGGYAQFYDGTKPCFCIFQRGTNDLGNNSTSALDTYNLLKAEVTKAKNAGFYVIVCTLLPRTGTTGNWNTSKEQVRLDYNQMLRADKAGADYLIDFTTNADMGYPTAPNDTTKYEDGLHPTSYGYGLLPPSYRTVLDPILSLPMRQPTLFTLTLSGALVAGTQSNGNIIGTTAGSTLDSGVPGLVVNSAARTYNWDGSGQAATYPAGLTEGLGQQTKNSPLTVQSASAARPALQFNSTPTFTTGRFGQALDASSTYAVVPTSTFPQNPTVPFTVEARVKASSPGFMCIAAEQNAWWFGAQSGTGYASMTGYSTGGYTDVVSTVNICDGAWHTVRAVFDTGSMQLYVDGVLVASSNAATAGSTGSQPMYIGSYQGSSLQWQGLIDEMAGFNSAKAGAYTPSTSAYAGNETGLLFLYHLDSDGKDSKVS